MKTLCISGGLIIVMMVLSTASFGGAFSVPEQGAVSTGMAGAFIAKADDLSAIFHNPAGLVQQKGTHVYLGATVYGAKGTYTRTGFAGEDVKGDLIPVPMFGVSTDFAGRLENLVCAFAVSSPFGLRVEYDELGAQRYIVQDTSLSTVYIGSYAAWQIAPKISIGGGIQYVLANAESSQRINYGGVLNPLLNENPDYDGELEGKDLKDQTFAANLGVLVRPIETLKVGLSWKSGMDLDIEGDAELTIPAPVTQLSGGLIQSLTTTVNTTVSVPQSIGFGVSYQLTEKLEVISDVNWFNWSVYEDLDFDFKDNTLFLPDQDQPRDWEDSWTFRIGTEYWLTDQYAVRAGYIYDQTPMPDKTHGPELPTNIANSLNLGLGGRWKNLSLDLAYAHIFYPDRTVESSIRNPQPIGKYESAANVFAMSVGYAF
jgi:long-chain fatty acid transport protein